jgi:hypothetical protein
MTEGKKYYFACTLAYPNLFGIKCFVVVVVIVIV